MKYLIILNTVLLLYVQAKRCLASTNCLIRMIIYLKCLQILLLKLVYTAITARFASCYWSDRPSYHDEWLLDFYEILKDVKEMVDGTTLIELENLLDHQLITIRKLDKSRYDLTGSIGQELKIYNLLSDAGNNNLMQDC